MIDLKVTTHSLLLLHACDYVPSSIPFLANCRCYDFMRNVLPSYMYLDTCSPGGGGYMGNYGTFERWGQSGGSELKEFMGFMI